MKFYRVNYTAFVTRVVKADSEESAYQDFLDNVRFGDCESDTGTCEELTNPSQRESAIRHHGLIKP